MKKTRFRFVYILSAVASIVLSFTSHSFSNAFKGEFSLSDINIVAFLLTPCILALVGLLLGMAVYSAKDYDKYLFPNRIQGICGIAIAVILSALGAYHFFTAWGTLEPVTAILAKFLPNPAVILLAASAALGLAALPFIAYASLFTVAIICKICKCLKFKELLLTVKTRFLSIKKFLLVVANIVVAVALGVCLLLGAYSLPIDRIENNVRASAETIQQEGTYPRLFAWCHSQLDNWTDSIMLLEAADTSVDSNLENAMLVYRGTIDGLDPAQSLTAHYLQDAEFTSTMSYARYWNGYLVILKALLTVFDYSTIRIINGIAQLALLAVVCLLLKRKNLQKYILPYVLCYLALMPVALASSLQFSSCYYVFTAGVIVLLSLKDTAIEKSAYLVFLNLGIATAFFDFLTYPIATFGIPAIIYCVLRKSNSLEEKLYATARNGILWCLGFSGMWASKWAVASILTGKNVVSNAMGALETRTSSEGVIYAIDTLCKNFTSFMFTPFVVIALLFLLRIFIKKLPCRNTSGNATVTIAPYVFIFLIPILWHIFASNHSNVHFWFTNKSFVVPLMAIMFALVELTQDNQSLKK